MGGEHPLKEHREVRLWFDRMTGTLMKGAIYYAKKKDFAEGLTGTLFSQVVIRGAPMRNGKLADTDLREGTCDKTSFGGCIGCPCCRTRLSNRKYGKKRLKNDSRTPLNCRFWQLCRQ
jgi:hypothetical protein